ncbi:urease accessory protein UreD [Thiosulfatimonas sediminis]|uniref:Urease accessory protein UreD n=1 Tax=Thiosulfatimonas sediminis TaxID=2675054 RepID=A0A6F8PSU5_9GAMM|nr:urease accessory protein UreD [Thiosulfatimonas sediminis]BBP45179.1 urease accessory protein UreD [Thiosulfatimonas sediminis]
MKALQTSWKGYLSFTLENRFGKTVVKDKQHFGPLVLQRAYYQEEERPTILVIHPPGGIVAGDELTTQVLLKPNAKVFISTPAATKFYRSTGACAVQLQQLTLYENTQLEWLPQEALFFNQCKVRNHLQFNLMTEQAALIAWDVVGFGRPAMNEVFSEGELHQKIEIRLADKPIFIDQFVFRNIPELMHNAFALNGQTLMATMLFYQSDAQLLSQLKEQFLQQDWAPQCGITLVDKVLVLRTLDSDLDDLKARLIAAWQLARPLIIGAPPLMPRIWKT